MPQQRRGCGEMSEITKALVKFQKTAPTVIKNRHVKAGTKEYHYADLAEIMGAIQPVLSDCGLFMTQVFDKENGSTLLVTRIMHESGELIASTIDLPINGLPPQQVGTLIPY